MTPSETLDYINSQIRSQTQPDSITPSVMAGTLDAVVKMDLPQTDGVTPPIYGQNNILGANGDIVLYYNGTSWIEIGRIGLQATTDGTGNNISSNTIQLTGIDNANLNIRSIVLYNHGMQLIDNSVVIGGITIGGATSISFGSANVALTTSTLTSNVPVVVPDATDDTQSVNRGQLKNLVFFSTATTDTTFVDEDIVGKRVLKIEGYGVFYYEGRDFTKDEMSDTINAINGQFFTAGNEYLLTTSYF